MKLFTILALFSCAVLLNSCAYILSGSKQEITINIPTKDVKLHIDNQYISTGSSFKTILEKNLDNNQLKFTAEGYKTKYSVLVADHKSNYHILSWIPFIVLYAPYFDDTPNTWTYEDSYTFPELRKYRYSDSTKKRLFVKKVAFDVAKSNSVLNVYSYNYYMDHSEPYSTSTGDSIGLSNTYFDESLAKVLRKLNYVDTVNTVFIDNVNTMSINAKVIKVVRNYIERRYARKIPTYNSFIECELTTEWILKNAYGDTLRTDTIVSKSDQFSENLKKDLQNRLSFEDALEVSMLDYLDSLSKSPILELESTKISFTDQIKVSKPSKVPTSIPEAMKASFTIKTKDGHGSGFLISHDGYLITNHHIVSGDAEFTVVSSEGNEYKAKVVRSNKAIDLALLKIEGNFDMAFNLPDKQNYNIGDEVVTIGTPKSVLLGQSVARGIVSGVRKNKGSNFMQTDISINPGNSGGPIISKTGELTAIVEYKLIGFATEGLSFAIPAYDVMQSLNLGY